MEISRDILLSIPCIQLSDYNATALCMMWSLQELACCSVDDILDATDMSPEEYAILSSLKIALTISCQQTMDSYT